MLVQGEVLTEIHRSGDFAVAIIRADDGSEVRLVGEFPECLPGDRVSAEGTHINNKYGPSFRVDILGIDLPTSEDGIKAYLQRTVPLIGKDIAGRIVEMFGKETIKTLNEFPENLRRVEGIGKKRAASIADAWREGKEEREENLFFYNIGVPSRFITPITTLWGVEAKKIITENPYSLMEIPRIGFKTADRCAKIIGFPEDHPYRVQAAFQEVLDSATGEGHACLPLVELVDRVAELLGLDAEFVVGCVSDTINNGILVFDKHEDEVFMYTKEEYSYERYVARKVSELVSNPPPIVKDVRMPSDIEPSEAQIRAVIGALSERVFIVTGGPGTGKTTITKWLLEELARAGMFTVVCAPTGRAAKRSHELTGHPAATIHRTLGFDPVTGGWDVSEIRPLPDDTAVVVDEASMLDLHLAYRVACAVPKSGKLILIGDVDQLPSVGAGDVLNDLIESGIVPYVRLDKVFRQAAQSMIISNAHRANKGLSMVFTPGPGQIKDMVWDPVQDPDEIQRKIIDELHYLGNRGVDVFNEVQVITPIHRGPIGDIELNTVVQDVLNSRGRVLKKGNGFLIRVGDKVKQTRNNYKKGVFNGEIGVVVEPECESFYEGVARHGGPKIKEAILAVAFPGQERLVNYDIHDSEDLKLAYAITIHVSQGSEYPYVIIPVHLSHRIMLTRNLIYTAVPRGKKEVIMIGQEEAMKVAVSVHRRGRRYTLLRPRLKKEM